MEKIDKPLEAWRDELSDAQFHVCRLGGTERAFTGKYEKNKANGEYHCAACGALLFDSGHKYDSGSGWPSFTDPSDGAAVEMHSDTTHGMTRTEVVCAKCDAHLGHVFPDGPPPTGLRYCINSVCLDLVPRN